jgi:hypothetical protein
MAGVPGLGSPSSAAAGGAKWSHDFEFPASRTKFHTVEALTLSGVEWLQA